MEVLAVAAGVHYWATILTPNEEEDAWLLLYEARGTRPPFWFRTHKPLMLCTGARTLSYGSGDLSLYRPHALVRTRPVIRFVLS